MKYCYLIISLLLFLQAILTKITYDLGYKQGRLDELEENLEMLNDSLFNNEDPFSDGE